MEVSCQLAEKRIRASCASWYHAWCHRSRPTNPMSCFGQTCDHHSKHSHQQHVILAILSFPPVVKQRPPTFCAWQSPARAPAQARTNAKIHSLGPAIPSIPPSKRAQRRPHQHPCEDPRDPGVDGASPTSTRRVKVEIQVVIRLLRACMPIPSVKVFVFQR